MGPFNVWSTDRRLGFFCFAFLLYIPAEKQPDGTYKFFVGDDGRRVEKKSLGACLAFLKSIKQPTS